MVIAFVLAGLGQSAWSRGTDSAALTHGWFFFLSAAILLALTLLPWRAENDAEAGFSPSLEKALLGLILVIAAFFRVYRLDQMPPGVFIDQGVAGDIALRILHQGYRPIYADDVLRNPPYLMYQLAVWFAFFKATAANFLLFFGLMSVGLVGLFYWTVRQIAGIRVALLSSFILAVMCWNVNFSRNGFPTIEVPFYMFGTLAFLMHALRSGKRWAFIVAALFFSGGMYTYQAYKIFPALLLILLAYEWTVDRQRIRERFRFLVMFAGLSFILMLPFAFITLHNGNNIWREQNYNIISQVREQHSMAPLVHMVTRTAKMFNIEGDSNERHNFPNRRMLDDVTGALFVLGLFFALSRWSKRPYFFALSGFLVMCLPCLLSQDPAHANRMLATTPFIALLAAFPIAALWAQIRNRWGNLGEILLGLLLVEPLVLMAFQNYQFYFVQQANFNGLWTTGIWAGYSVPETRVGQEIARDGSKYDYFLTQRFYDYPTINFLAFDQKKDMHRLVMPEDLAPLKSDGQRGLQYVLMKEHQGVLELLQSIYPRGHVTREADLKGDTIVQYFTVPQDSVQEARGVAGTVDGRPAHWPDFPKNVGGAHQFSIHGCLFIDQADRYSFQTALPGVHWVVAGRSVGHGVTLELARGFYAFEARWNASRSNANPGLTLVNSASQRIPVTSTNTTTLPLDRGLRGSWYQSINEDGKLNRVEWNPVINFPHGGDFNSPFDPLFIHWRGVLIAPQSGTYRFGVWTDEYARLNIDGHRVFDGKRNPTGDLSIAAGPHRVDFYFKKELGPILSLLWKTPRGGALQPIPMSAFGKTEPGF